MRYSTAELYTTGRTTSVSTTDHTTDVQIPTQTTPTQTTQHTTVQTTDNTASIKTTKHTTLTQVITYTTSGQSIQPTTNVQTTDYTTPTQTTKHTTQLQITDYTTPANTAPTTTVTRSGGRLNPFENIIVSTPNSVETSAASYTPDHDLSHTRSEWRTPTNEESTVTRKLILPKIGPDVPSIITAIRYPITRGSSPSDAVEVITAYNNSNESSEATIVSTDDTNDNLTDTNSSVTKEANTTTTTDPISPLAESNVSVMSASTSVSTVHKGMSNSSNLWNAPL